jgi:short-subunit dehydrogenase
MSKDLEASVVVITGASSGIGRATALEFARKGANVVLAARREHILRTVGTECKQLSGREALVVPTDVSNEAAVQNLARQTFEHFGHIDIWVNNAGVGAYGRFEEMPAEIYRQVIETNLFGTTYGARSVLPYFRQQGYGTLINLSSLVGTVSGPYYSAYAISKFGIRALGETLREEINILDGASNINICTVMPATIDTPFFRHSANYAGRAVKPLPPVYPVEKVARTIVKCAERPQREVFVGNAGRMIAFVHTFAPLLAEPMMAKQINSGHFKQEAAPPTPGNVLEPMQAGTGTSDGWLNGNQSSKRGIITVGLTTLASSFLTWLWLKYRRRHQSLLS